MFSLREVCVLLQHDPSDATLHAELGRADHEARAALVAKLGHLSGCRGRRTGSHRSAGQLGVAAAVRVQFDLLRLQGGRRNRWQRRLGTARIVERVLLLQQLLTSDAAAGPVMMMVRPSDRVRLCVLLG